MGFPRKSSTIPSEVKPTIIFTTGIEVFDLCSSPRATDRAAAKRFLVQFDDAFKQLGTTDDLYAVLVAVLGANGLLCWYLARSSSLKAPQPGSISPLFKFFGRGLLSTVPHFISAFDDFLSRLHPLSPPDHIFSYYTHLVSHQILGDAVARVLSQSRTGKTVLVNPLFSEAENRAGTGKTANPLFSEAENQAALDLFDYNLPKIAQRGEVWEKDREVQYERGRLIQQLASFLWRREDPYNTRLDDFYLSAPPPPPQPVASPQPTPARTPKGKNVLVAPNLAPVTISSNPGPTSPAKKRERAQSSAERPLTQISSRASKRKDKNRTTTLAAGSSSYPTPSSLPPLRYRPTDFTSSSAAAVVAEGLSSESKVTRLLDLNKEGYGEWKIILSGRAERKLKGLKDRTLTELVAKKLEELSKGNFWGDKQKRLIGNGHDVLIYEAKVVGDVRLVYQVDLTEDDGDGRVHQILRETHATIDKRLWSAISHTKAFEARSFAKGSTYVQIIFGKEPKRKASQHLRPSSRPRASCKSRRRRRCPISAISRMNNATNCRTSCLSKFIPLTHAVMRSMIAQDDEALHMFDVSPIEERVVNYPSSSFVIGHSGTGKTTSIIIRMLSIQLAREQDQQRGFVRDREGVPLARCLPHPFGADPLDVYLA